MSLNSSKNNNLHVFENINSENEACKPSKLEKRFKSCLHKWKCLLKIRKLCLTTSLSFSGLKTHRHIKKKLWMIFFYYYFETILSCATFWIFSKVTLVAVAAYYIKNTWRLLRNFYYYHYYPLVWGSFSVFSRKILERVSIPVKATPLYRKNMLSPMHKTTAISKFCATVQWS